MPHALKPRYLSRSLSLTSDLRSQTAILHETIAARTFIFGNANNGHGECAVSEHLLLGKNHSENFLSWMAIFMVGSVLWLLESAGHLCGLFSHTHTLHTPNLPQISHTHERASSPHKYHKVYSTAHHALVSGYVLCATSNCSKFCSARSKPITLFK